MTVLARVRVAVVNVIRSWCGLERLVLVDDEEYRRLIGQAAVATYLDERIAEARAQTVRCEAQAVIYGMVSEAGWQLDRDDVDHLTADPPVDSNGHVDEPALRDRVETRLAGDAVERLLATIDEGA